MTNKKNLYYQPVILGMEHGVTFGQHLDLYAISIELLTGMATYDEKAAEVLKIRTSKLGKHLEGIDG